MLTLLAVSVSSETQTPKLLEHRGGGRSERRASEKPSEPNPALFWRPKGQRTARSGGHARGEQHTQYSGLSARV